VLKDADWDGGRRTGVILHCGGGKVNIKLSMLLIKNFCTDCGGAKYKE
jgi:hypothetical protein